MIMVMDRIALIFAIIGALSWGSVGIFGYNFLAAVFGGSGGTLTRVMYTLIGLSALWCISLIFRPRETVDIVDVVDDNA